MTIPVVANTLDAVKIGERFRICHGATETPVEVAEGQALDDTWESTLDPEYAQRNVKGVRRWVLSRRAENAEVGFQFKSAAERCAMLCELNKLEILE